MKRLTYAQRRLLERMIAAPGSAVSIHSDEEVSYDKGPTFRGRFQYAPCPTCRHSVSEPVSWRVIHALSEAGLIVRRMRGSDYYLSEDITPETRRLVERLANAEAP